MCAGEAVSEARASAYAAMHRKEVIRLSKDSINQINQTSGPRHDEAHHRSAPLLATSAPGIAEPVLGDSTSHMNHASPIQNGSSSRHASSPDAAIPQQQHAGLAQGNGSNSNGAVISAADDECVDSTAPRHDHSGISEAAADTKDVIDISSAGPADGVRSTSGGYNSVSEMKENGLTVGMSSDLDALFAEAGVVSDGGNIGSRQEADCRVASYGMLSTHVGKQIALLVGRGNIACCICNIFAMYKAAASLHGYSSAHECMSALLVDTSETCGTCMGSLHDTVCLSQSQMFAKRLFHACRTGSNTKDAGVLVIHRESSRCVALS